MKLLFPGMTGLCALLIVGEALATVLYVDPNNSTPASPYAQWSTAANNIQDAIDAAVAGDTILVTNGVYQTGNRVSPDGTASRVVITNSVVLQSVNGALATTIDGGKAVRCVYLANGAALDGFTVTNGKGGSGGGVNCASQSERISNCRIVGNTGSSGGGVLSGTLTNCTVSGNVSGNGINNRGGGAYGSVLSDCILTGNRCGNNVGNDGGGAFGCELYSCAVSNNSVNSTYGSGGGICNCVASNCTITGNSASTGGGAAYSTVGKITLSGNSAFVYGGATAYGNINNCALLSNNTGAWRGTLSNCLLAGNTYDAAKEASLVNCTVVGNGEGVVNGSAVNCIVYNNGSNYADSWPGSVTLNYCCTTPLPPGGTGNFTAAPGFADLPTGDFRLAPNSPCINSGKSQSVIGGTDLDGNSRIVAGTVDVGAYEYPTPASLLSYAWAQQFGLPTDGSADYGDADGDGLNNYGEWIAGTLPNNSASALRLLSPQIISPGIRVTWQSVNTRIYFVQRSTNLSSPEFVTIRSNVVGASGTTFYNDTTAIDPVPYFYRVGVER